MPEKTYTLLELAEAANISGRTIRYYIAMGVLRNPVQRGCNAHYTDEHLERLRSIKAHQANGVTLAGIKSLLEGNTHIVEYLIPNPIMIHSDGSQTREFTPVVNYVHIPIQDGVTLEVRADVFQARRFLLIDTVLELARNLKEYKI